MIENFIEFCAKNRYLLHSESRHASVKIRSFVDLIAERLRAESSLN